MPFDSHREVIEAAGLDGGQGAMLASQVRDVEAPATGTPTSLERIDPRPPRHHQVPPQIGSTVKHYELLRKLGEGGMGTVYLARDTMLGRLVAIKVLQMHSGPNAERFLIEAQATARCRHDNIVVVHEVDSLHGYQYMVLEYLEGRTLREWMAQRERLADVESAATPEPPSRLVSPSLAVELMLPVVRALACAHQLGIVHRDLKPENIFLTGAGRVVVLDFGIAKQLDASDLSAFHRVARPLEYGARLTQDGVLLGTLPYMSPEQLRSEDIDPRSDLWTVGILLYELVTGAHPLSHCSMLELLDIGDSDEPMPSIRDSRPGIGALGAIIDRCLQKPRDRRYRSADELLAALEALALGRTASGLGEDDSPFPGLSAFQEADAVRYVGRDRDVASLTGRLRNQALLVVAGPSGAGKSSFVRAGLISALKRSGERWEALILRPGRRPLAQLADLLAQLGPATGGHQTARAAEDSDSEPLLDALSTQPGLVGVRLRARCGRERGPQRILLYVDQFEELYTLGADAAERAAFVACLEGVADDASSPLRVVLSIRSDYLYRMAEEGHFLAETPRGLCFLRPMGREDLRDALLRPLTAAGYRFESEAMIEAMLDGLERTKSPLPLLQFTAARLWEARDRASRCLTQASYDLTGGVAGALSAHANAVLSSLSSADQRLCRAVLLRLCTPERTRAVVSLSDLQADAADGGAVEQVIRRLSDARLVVIEASGDREGTTVELCHEALIESWDKLQQWLAESQQDTHFVSRLYTAAHQWEARQTPEGLLWRDRAAREATDWLARRHAEQGAEQPLGLGAREERFLRAVVALSERTRRRRRRIMVGALATIGMVAIVVFILSLSAKRQAVAAQLEARQARNATRMAIARDLAQKDPTTMLVLLREIEPPGVPRGWAELASKALQSALACEVRFWGADAYGAAWSPDGQRVVAALQDGTARVWKVGDSAEPIVLRGHEAEASMAAFSPDGTHIVTTSDDTVRVWMANGSGQPIVLRGHEAWVSMAAFSPDGTHIVTASGDKTVRVWMADGSGQPIVLRGHETPVATVAFSPDGTRIVTTSMDNSARVWNADGTGQPVILRGHDDRLSSATFSPDGQRIVTTSSDKTVRVWNADGSGEPDVLRGHEGMVSSAAFSPDGRHIVTGSDDKTVRVWNADGSGEPLVLRGHEGQVISAAFSPDGKRIVTASSTDRTVRIWNADDSGEPLVLRGHENWVSSAAWSPDGASIVTASLDQTTRVFRIDLLSASAPILLRGHESSIRSVAFSADNQQIVTGSDDKTARVWRADGSGQAVVLRGHEGSVYWVAFSPDDRRVVTTSYDQTARTARVWRADGSGQPVVLRGHEGPIWTAEFSPDSQRVVTASYDRTARVWRADGSGQPVVLRGHEREVWWAGFSPDGKHVATLPDDPMVHVWSSDGDFAQDEPGWPKPRSDGSGEAHVYRDRGREFRQLVWSPDSKRILVGGLDNTARVWAIDRPEEPMVLRAHDQLVSWAAWSPDGKRIVTASADATARVWNADGSGDPVVLRGHASELAFVAFSRDGEHILTTSMDETARVWNADGTGEPYVLSLPGGQEVGAAAFSPDGTHIVTAFAEKIARVWPLGAPFRGTDDPRLWTATPYCLSIERRIALLSMSEARARADQEACERRVKAAGTAAGGQ